MPRIQTGPDTHDILDNPQCPVCASPAKVYRRKTPWAPYESEDRWSEDVYEGYCETCRDLRITLSACEWADRQGKKHLISAWLRRRPTDARLELLNDDAVDKILKDTPAYDVLDKLDLTLNQIEKMTLFPGLATGFQSEKDYPLIYAQGRPEALFYIRQLADLGYIDRESVERGGQARIVAKGYERLREIRRASRQSAFVFVAMKFDPSMDEIYDGAIEVAVGEAGYKAVRLDREHHSNNIDDEIIGRIKGSRFMVADFTGQSQGVYFEAGLMLGLGRTVIRMCKQEDLKHLHFDQRQYNFIDYESVENARNRLRDRIIAIEGEGPEPTVTK